VEAIVSIDEDKERGMTMLHSFVSCSRHITEFRSDVFGVQNPTDHSLRIIVTGVVNDNDLFEGNGLGLKSGKALGKISSVIMARHDGIDRSFEGPSYRLVGTPEDPCLS